jgi:uncharacterized protein (DUF488 family)
VRLYTIGHSTHAIDTLIDLLRTHGVRALVDVRSLPHSRRHPQCDRAAMPEPLAAAGIAYTHLPGLGGLRAGGYAAYMETPAFAAGLATLIAHARGAPTAIMCAEADPTHCHRWLLSHALVAAGVDVQHIRAVDRADAHTVTPLQRNLFLPGAGG